MMKMKYFILLFTFAFTTPAFSQFGDLLKKADNLKKDILGGESTLDISGGLKEALENGVTESVKTLSAQNGFLDSPYKILIPEDARKVVSTVSKVPGFQNVEKELISKMNDAAEIAAKKATPIFINAIKQMTIKDAKDILLGNKNAATAYLEKTSRTQLYDEFMPIIQGALKEVDATKYWSDVMSKYNKVPFVKKVNPDLDDHVNQKALDGLFSLVEKKELGIREDVGQRTSPLLKEVFAQQD